MQEETCFFLNCMDFSTPSCILGAIIAYLHICVGRFHFFGTTSAPFLLTSACLSRTTMLTSLMSAFASRSYALPLRGFTNSSQKYVSLSRTSAFPYPTAAPSLSIFTLPSLHIDLKLSHLLCNLPSTVAYSRD